MLFTGLFHRLSDGTNFLYSSHYLCGCSWGFLYPLHSVVQLKHSNGFSAVLKTVYGINHSPESKGEHSSPLQKPVVSLWNFSKDLSKDIQGVPCAPGGLILNSQLDLGIRWLLNTKSGKKMLSFIVFWLHKTRTEEATKQIQPLEIQEAMNTRSCVDTCTH